MAKDKCEHKEWARVWLASKNYALHKFCKKCLIVREVNEHKPQQREKT